MNFKEAFRYQKYLDELFDRTTMYLSSSGNSRKKIETHFIHEVNPDAEDKIEEITGDTEYKFTDALKLMHELIEEREAICFAIDKAKLMSGYDMDAASETNKFRRRAYRAVKSLLEPPRKPVEIPGKAFKFDVNGTQVPYTYRIECKFVDLYERSEVRKLAKDLIETADKVSQEVDTYMTNTHIDFNPKFSVNDTFDDLMESFKTVETQPE